MSGFFIYFFLVALAFFELGWGIFAMILERKSGPIKNFIPYFTFFAVFICGGHGLAAIIPDASIAYIPRFFGLWGCVGFLLSEIAAMVYFIEMPQLMRYITIGATTVLGILDIIMGGGKKAVSFVSNDYYNKMEIADKLGHTIHLVYLGVMTLILVFLSVKWYKAKKSTRERRFVIQIIIANYTLLLAALPDIFAKSTSLKYPNVFYCIAFAIIFFAWISTLRKRLSLDMSIKNVSEGIFYSIDVPIIIFSETGQISFYNPSAEKFLGLKDKDSKNITIKDIFTLSDVEEMRLLNKAKHGENYLLKISNDEIKKNCLLKCSVKLDDTGELYCIIGTILQDSQELNNEEGNL